jgi:EAL domain-containing protein (putative c-di-GMP-specific phosphodiesterase class I)
VEYITVVDGGTPAAMVLERDLRQALDGDDLFLEFQPIVSLETGSVIGAEALLRWRHPRYGMVPPSDFVPVAEATGLIHELGSRVLREAVFTARRWQTLLPPRRQLYLSVNLSPVQLSRTGLVAEVAGVLHAADLDPTSLVLEVTGEQPGPEGGRAPQLRELRALGLRIALDDFGTGSPHCST